MALSQSSLVHTTCSICKTDHQHRDHPSHTPQGLCLSRAVLAADVGHWGTALDIYYKGRRTRSNEPKYRTWDTTANHLQTWQWQFVPVTEPWRSSISVFLICVFRTLCSSLRGDLNLSRYFPLIKWYWNLLKTLCKVSGCRYLGTVIFMLPCHPLRTRCLISHNCSFLSSSSWSSTAVEDAVEGSVPGKGVPGADAMQQVCLPAASGCLSFRWRDTKIGVSFQQRMPQYSHIVPHHNKGQNFWNYPRIRKRTKCIWDKWKKYILNISLSILFCRENATNLIGNIFLLLQWTFHSSSQDCSLVS